MIERRKKPRGNKPTDEEIRRCFHRIWTSQVGERGYTKHDWLELQKMLFRRGVAV